MEKYQTLLYYKYTSIEDPETFTRQHLDFCNSLDLKGRIIIAYEGINGTVSGLSSACARYMEAIESDPRFEGIHWKIDDVEEPSFAKMHVRFKHELCHMGIEDLDPNELTGIYLKPEDFQKMMAEADTVILDVRNTVEHELGKFKDAITLDIEHFRDFPAKVKELEPLKDKRVLAYCTGGIRCEKATAYLIRNGFDNVFQLDGGIVTYGKETGGKDFEGKCYVFDKRIGVKVNSVNPSVITKCHICGTTTDRMINCANPECNQHIPMCENCGWEYDGACSDSCRQHDRKRAYNGTGYYMKGDGTLVK